MSTDEIHILEWSRRGRDFHLSPLALCLATNQAALMHQQPTDHLTVWVGPKAACERMAQVWQGRLHAVPVEPDIHGVPV